MSKKLKLLTLFLFLVFTMNSQETALFDIQRNAQAYIDYNDDSTIYLLNEKLVAFLKNDRRDIHIFGFNGNFFGWYENGIVRSKKS